MYTKVFETRSLIISNNMWSVSPY